MAGILKSFAIVIGLIYLTSSVSSDENHEWSSEEEDPHEPDMSWAEVWWGRIYDYDTHSDDYDHYEDMYEVPSPPPRHNPGSGSHVPINNEELRLHPPPTMPPYHGSGEGSTDVHGPQGAVCERTVKQTYCEDRPVIYPCWKKTRISCRQCRRDCRREGQTCYQMRRDRCQKTERRCDPRWITVKHCCSGYEEQDGGECKLVNSCNDDNGGCDQICKGQGPNDHYCECFEGYHRATQNQCEDIDECALGMHRCSHECVNTLGSYYCYCEHGYHLEGDTGQCREIDECALENGGCMHQCTNTIGAFYCECDDGFELVIGFACQASENRRITTTEETRHSRQTSDSIHLPVIAGSSVAAFIIVVSLVIFVTIFIVRRKPNTARSSGPPPVPTEPIREDTTTYQAEHAKNLGEAGQFENYGYEKPIDSPMHGIAKPWVQPPLMGSVEQPPSYLDATAPPPPPFIPVAPVRPCAPLPSHAPIPIDAPLPTHATSPPRGDETYETYEVLTPPYSRHIPTHVYDNLGGNGTYVETPEYIDIISSTYEEPGTTRNEDNKTTGQVPDKNELAQAMRNLKKVKK